MELDAFVLAAGLGTRIGRLSQHRPKPLLPVGATTPLENAVARLREAGARRVVANAAHLAEQVVATGARIGVEVVVEPSPSGTAGGLAAARARLDPRREARVAIWNGDILADVEVGALVRALDDDPRALGALAVHDLRPRGEGNVGLSADFRVVRLRDRAHPSLGEEAHGASFSAVAVLDRALVDRAPARGCMVADVYLPALAAGETLRAVAWSGAFFDIGDEASYLAANLATLRDRASSVGEGARVGAGVSLDRAIVGASAIVEGEGALREVVVWPGARVNAPRSRAIVLDSGEIVEVG